MTRRYAFYPGCTLHSTGIEFGLSTHAVCHALDIDLVEIPDWNCCGASSAHSLDRSLFLALPARNLAMAQLTGLDDLAIPCAACYSRLAAAHLELQLDPALRSSLEHQLDFHFQNRVHPRSLLDILANDFSRNDLQAPLLQGLKDLKVAAYYGCLLIRPPTTTNRWDDPEHPSSLDRLLSWMGAQPVPWSFAVDCCGGSLTLNRSDVVVHLVDRLISAAHEAGADALATACPMCMANVDGRQLFRGGSPFPRKPKTPYQPLPIFYFTELIALAYSLPIDKALAKHFVDPHPLLGERKIGCW